MNLINATSHQFSKRQVKHLQEKYLISSIEDISEKNYNLFMILSNMSGEENILSLSSELFETIKGYYYAVLPIGSPIFMAQFIIHYCKHNIKTKLLFSIMKKKIVQTQSGKSPRYKFVGFAEVKK